MGDFPFIAEYKSEAMDETYTVYRHSCKKGRAILRIPQPSFGGTMRPLHNSYFLNEGDKNCQVLQRSHDMQTWWCLHEDDNIILEHI